MPEHKDLTGANLHEPKGVDAASVDQVYMSDGAGSGAWTSLPGLNKVYLWGRIPDISTAGSIYIPSPVAGDISAIYVTLQAAITVANSIVTAEIANVAVTGLSVTCAFTGSAPGSTFSDTSITTNKTVAAGGTIEVITDGGSTTASEAIVLIVLDV